jgi:hypothetical protein
VRARVLTSASPSEIRALADEAAERARGHIRTVTEARRLMDRAMEHAQKISELMGRLAELTEDGDLNARPGSGDPQAHRGTRRPP